MAIDADLQVVYDKIVVDALHAEDVFGSEDVVLPAETLLEFLAEKYNILKDSINPKSYSHPDDIEAAREASTRLEAFYEDAEKRIRAGTFGLRGYGRPKPAHARKSFSVGENVYHLGHKLEVGEHCTFYEAFLERDGVIVGEVVVKLSNSADDNHLAQREIRNLEVLHRKGVPQWKHLPFIYDRFESGGRIGLVLRRVSGLSLAQLRTRSQHRQGVDQKHMVWMLDRSLSCLGYVHRCGIVHGNLCPEHFMVRAENHNAILVGWGSGVYKPAKTGEKVEQFSDSFAAPEVKERGAIGPWSDIYSLGKLMIWLVGGDPVTGDVAEFVETPLAQFLRKLTHEDHHRRPSDAWELYAEQHTIKDSLWPRRFLHLDVS